MKKKRQFVFSFFNISTASLYLTICLFFKSDIKNIISLDFPISNPL